MKTLVPTLPELGREAIIVIAGALIAALVLSQLPSVRAYIQKNTTGGGCSCP